MKTRPTLGELSIEAADIDPAPGMTELLERCEAEIEAESQRRARLKLCRAYRGWLSMDTSAE